MSRDSLPASFLLIRQQRILHLAYQQCHQVDPRNERLTSLIDGLLSFVMSFPYTYFRCPCADATLESSSEEPDRDVEQENSFDPQAPRASFSLYPLEHLLWCEECHDIRCPRCVIEEVICWYCPSCLFEVASQSVRQDGNR